MRIKSYLVSIALGLLLVGGLTLASPATAAAAGPCRVTAFSYHAKIAMIDDGYTEGDVREAVSQFCGRGFRQSNGNWQYPSDTSFLPTVILSDNGTVVTVYAPNAGGGGGGGSWIQVS